MSLDGNYLKGRITKIAESCGGASNEVLDSVLILANSLMQILSLPQKRGSDITHMLTQKEWGYNQALEDVRQAIKGEVK